MSKRKLSSNHSGTNDQEVEKDWNDHFGTNGGKKYIILASPEMEEMAERISNKNPKRFLYHRSSWGKFPDGTDNIVLGGYSPVNLVSGEDVIFLSSFHNNDATLSQFSAFIVLLQSFINSLTIVLPFYPVGTMERVVHEGQVATANTFASMLSNLPSCGKPTRLVIYDLHTLQNRFFFHHHTIASMQTTIPLLKAKIQDKSCQVTCVAFPDEGAAKRFSYMFADYEIVTCGKVRIGEERKVSIQDGDANGKDIIIIDDLVQTGGTLYECGVALRAAGAKTVKAFVAHAVFPKESWKRFLRSGDRNCFDQFYVTNSIPSVVKLLPQDDVFEIFDISEKIVDDIDSFTS